MLDRIRPPINLPGGEIRRDVNKVDLELGKVDAQATRQALTERRLRELRELSVDVHDILYAKAVFFDKVDLDHEVYNGVEVTRKQTSERRRVAKHGLLTPVKGALRWALYHAPALESLGLRKKFLYPKYEDVPVEECTARWRSEGPLPHFSLELIYTKNQTEEIKIKGFSARYGPRDRSIAHLSLGLADSVSYEGRNDPLQIGSQPSLRTASFNFDQALHFNRDEADELQPTPHLSLIGGDEQALAEGAPLTELAKLFIEFSRYPSIRDYLEGYNNRGTETMEFTFDLMNITLRMMSMIDRDKPVYSAYQLKEDGDIHEQVDDKRTVGLSEYTANLLRKRFGLDSYTEKLRTILGVIPPA